jgi:hypothetical protein
MSQVSRPVGLIVPISLAPGLGQLHHVLRNYKDGSTDEVRRPLLLQVAAILSRFIQHHGACVESAAGGPWDLVTNVPSHKREGTHPLERVLSIAPTVKEKFRPVLRPGPVRVTWRKADDQGYLLTEDVRGRRALLVDDTFTTGANIQSAASALHAGGATVVAGVSIGRFVRTDFAPVIVEILDWSTGIPFDFGSCLLCGPDFVAP